MQQHALSARTPNHTPTPDSPLAHLSSADLEAQITALAGQLNAATYRWLTLIAEFDRRNGWADGLLKSCAHWLNFKVGLNLGAAREKVRVAHALAGVPKIAAAMARGHLSYSKVRALTRVASAATEETLLMIALHGTAHHVETVVRYFRQVEEAAALSREAQQQATRAVDYTESADGEPLDVGRKTRTIPPAIRRALHARDPGCCFPGCTAGRSLDAHHVEHWADGGATKLSNLVSLCRHHHRLVHEGGIRVEARAGGGWRFRRPDGREFEVVRPEPAPDHHWTRLQATHDTLGIRIDAHTAATRWSGERLDYHLAIPILCAQAGIPAPVCGPYGTGGVTAAATSTAPRRVSAATRVSAETSADTDPTESPEDWDGDDGMSYWNGTEWVP